MRLHLTAERHLCERRVGEHLVGERAQPAPPRTGVDLARPVRYPDLVGRAPPRRDFTGGRSACADHRLEGRSVGRLEGISCLLEQGLYLGDGHRLAPLGLGQERVCAGLIHSPVLHRCAKGAGQSLLGSVDLGQVTVLCG